MKKNVFTYWQGPKPSIIQQLDEFLFSVCRKMGYSLHDLNAENITEYIEIHESFLKIKNIVDITDFLRIQLLSKYGGIWLDRDVLVRRGFDELFDAIEEGQGFVVGFPLRNRMGFNNAILGAKDDSDFYKKWLEHNKRVLAAPMSEWRTLPFGNSFLKKTCRWAAPEGIKIINGTDSKIEPFVNFKKNIALSDKGEELILASDPPLIHIFNKNCSRYQAMSDEDKQNTALYKLICSVC